MRLYPRDLKEANFNNCIIYGNLITEISPQENQTRAFNYSFNHSLIKLDPTTNTNNSQYTNVIINQDPDFIDITTNDFHIKNTSPAINSGYSSVITNDIEGNIRDQQPDLGVYEYQD